MTSSALFAFLHHAAAFLLVAVVMVELVLLRGELTVASARTLLRMDSVYGLSAVVLLIVGFVRVFSTEKGADYYFHSGPFLVKLALFIVVGLLSILPTVQFLGWRKALKDRTPARARRWQAAALAHVHSHRADAVVRHHAVRSADGARHRIHRLTLPNPSLCSFIARIARHSTAVIALAVTMTQSPRR